MTDIIQKLQIDAPATKVFAAVSTVPGLAGWWTTNTQGESSVGKTLDFRFNEHLIQMRVDEVSPGKRVVWECTRSDPDWVGTRFTFDLTEDNGRTTLVFGQRGWREANAHFAHCSMKWATFLLSLREYVERGAGRPFPHDVRI